MSTFKTALERLLDIRSESTKESPRISSPMPIVKTLGYHDVVIRSPESTVYLEYSPLKLPPKPTEGRWTRFVCISDTHAMNFSVPDGDVLLHSGDLTNSGLYHEFEKTVNWILDMPHKFKIIIAGNHDLTLHTEYYDANHERWHHRAGKQNLKKILDLMKGEKATKDGLVYLEDESYTFKVTEEGKEWSVYGSPWSPEFCNWAFGYEREDAEALIAKFPKTDILLTHGPAYGILDVTNRDINAGCEALRARLPELRPQIHLFGHIHEAHGAYIHTWDTDVNPDAPDGCPLVQNEDAPQERVGFDGEGTLAGTKAGPVTDGPTLSKERSIFVNAAAWPSGRLASRDGVRPPFGGPGFQPIVIDIKED